jgi:predicted membrane channel-forming protein YqfA (hemolysin III family)
MAGKEQQEDIFDSIFHGFVLGSVACFYIISKESVHRKAQVMVYICGGWSNE